MGYYGDCRDCYYYSTHFHKICNNEYEYKCDICNEYFNDYYGSTCYLLEEKEDVARAKRAAQKRKEKIAAGVGLINVLIEGDNDYDEEDYSDPSINQNSYTPQQGFPWDALLYVLLSTVPMIIFGWIFIIKPIFHLLSK